MGKILFILTLCLASMALADDLPNYPGWSLTKIQAEAEEGTYSAGADYYALTPPDSRPAITVDARTAAALKAGQSQPEKVYAGSSRAVGNAQGGKEDDYVYSAANNGFVQADASPTSSFAPQPDSGVIGSIPPAEPADRPQTFAPSASSPFRPSGTSAGYSGSGASASAGSSGAGTFPRPASGASSAPSFPSVPNVASAEPAAAVSVNQLQRPVSAEPEPTRGLAANNAAPRGPMLAGGTVQTGFGFNKDRKTPLSANPETRTETATQTQTQTATNTVGATFTLTSTNTNTGTSTSTHTSTEPDPPCTAFSKVYDSPAIERVTLPIGCRLVYVTAWGAGGGSVTYTYQAGSGDHDYTRTITNKGGGGAFVNATGHVDAHKYDLVVVVGRAGANGGIDGSGEGGEQGKGGDGGRAAIKGAGGGGYSGVFLVNKGGSAREQKADKALAVASGGGGAGAGTAGRPGRIEEAGGGSGGNGSTLQGGEGADVEIRRCPDNHFGHDGDTCNEATLNANSKGGGGGGGGVRGGGGGGPGQGGGGGSSVARMEQQITDPGDGAKAGYFYFPGREGAGDAGKHGKVKLEYY